MRELPPGALGPEVAAAARGVLREVFGFDSFRPGQAEVIGALLAGDHVLAVMLKGCRFLGGGTVVRFPEFGGCLGHAG